jgi:hypothetical protein
VHYDSLITASVTFTKGVTAMATCWHTHHNHPGFLPESEAQCHLTREDAAVAVGDDMRYYADMDDEDTLATVDPSAYADEEAYWASDDVPCMLATVESILRDDGPERVTGEWGARVEDGAGRMVYFGLAPVGDCDHAGCEHDD